MFWRKAGNIFVEVHLFVYLYEGIWKSYPILLYRDGPLSRTIISVLLQRFENLKNALISARIGEGNMLNKLINWFFSIFFYGKWETWGTFHFLIVCLATEPTDYISVCLSKVYLSAYLSISLCIYLYVDLFMFLSFSPMYVSLILSSSIYGPI